MTVATPTTATTTSSIQSATNYAGQNASLIGRVRQRATVEDELSDVSPAPKRVKTGSITDSSRIPSEGETCNPNKEISGECCCCRNTLGPLRYSALPCKHLYCPACLEKLFRKSFKDERLFPPRCCKNEFDVFEAHKVIASNIRDEGGLSGTSWASRASEGGGPLRLPCGGKGWSDASSVPGCGETQTAPIELYREVLRAVELLTVLVPGGLDTCEEVVYLLRLCYDILVKLSE